MAVAHGVQGWQRCQGIDRRAGWALQAGDKKTAAPSFPSRPSFASAHARSTKTRALQAEKPSPPARPSAPRRRRPPTSVRSLVLEQLLRVEEKGAFAALASGDPGAEGAAMPSPPRTGGTSRASRPTSCAGSVSWTTSSTPSTGTTTAGEGRPRARGGGPSPSSPA